MPRNIFVLGLDERNRSTLANLPGAADYRFHRLVGRAPAQGPAEPDAP